MLRYGNGCVFAAERCVLRLCALKISRSVWRTLKEKCVHERMLGRVTHFLATVRASGSPRKRVKTISECRRLCVGITCVEELKIVQSWQCAVLRSTQLSF